MPIVDTLLHGVLAPALVAGLALLIGWRPWRRERQDGRWSGSLAIGLAFFAAYTLVAGLPPLPFGDRTLAAQEWLAWLALAGGIAFALERRLGRAALALRIALAAGFVLAVLPMQVRREWDLAQAERWQLALIFGLLLVWGSTETLARRASGASMSAALLVAGACLALGTGLTGSVFLAQLAGALTAAVGAALVLSWWRRDVTLAGPGIAIWAVLHAGLAICASFYSSMPPGDAFLLGFAPVLAWAGELPVVRRRPGAQIALVRALAVALPAGVAVVRAALAFEADPYASY